MDARPTRRGDPGPAARGWGVALALASLLAPGAGCGPSSVVSVDLVHASFDDPYRGLDTLRISVLDGAGAALSIHNLDPFAPDLRLEDLGSGAGRLLRIEGLAGGAVRARGRSGPVDFSADADRRVTIPFVSRGVAVALPLAAVAPAAQIDGRLDEWAGAPLGAMLGPADAQIGQVGSEAELSAQVYAGWAPEGVYVALAVRDGCTGSLAAPEKVIVSYDGRGDRETTGYGTDDGNVILGPTVNVAPAGVSSAVSPTPGGYGAEILLPYAVLQIDAPSGPVRIGFEIELFCAAGDVYGKVETLAPSPDPFNRRPLPAEMGDLGLVLLPP